MSAFLIGFFGGVALAFIAKNFVMMLRAYRALPAQVPDHFNEYGDPDAYGPRPVIFAMVPASLVILGVWLAAMIASNAAAGPICISGTVADVVIIAFFYLQRGMLNVATGKCERMHPYAFWRN